MSTEERKKQLREANKRWRDSHPTERASRAQKYMKNYRANNKELLRFAEIKRKYGLSKSEFFGFGREAGW